MRLIRDLGLPTLLNTAAGDAPTGEAGTAAASVDPVTAPVTAAAGLAARARTTEPTSAAAQRC